MKYFLPLFISVLTVTAQNTPITNTHYDLQKKNGLLESNKNYFITEQNQKQIQQSQKISPPTTFSASSCNCIVPLDTSFQVVQFTNGIPPEYRNDDGSTNAIPIPFAFCFYGTPYNTIYINNNGNISFQYSSSVFSSTGFPNATDQMIAPFWADVDTRDTASGLVYYKVTPTSVIIKWESVGYYSMHSDKLATFQLIITDGTDSILPAGNNVGFCYDNMDWTTGDASSGISGFGGVPATVGVNKGDGVAYYQIGRFDQIGSAYDGSYNLSDGVDFLDYKSMFFNTCLSAANTPAIAFDTLCDTVPVYLATNTGYDIFLLAMEANQTLSWNALHVPAGMTLTQAGDSNTMKLIVSYIPQSTMIDSLLIQYQDNGQGTQMKTYKKYFLPDNTVLGVSGEIEIPVNLFPNPAQTEIIISGIKEETAITVTNLLSEVVISTNISNTNNRLDISGLKPGVYLLNVSTPGGAKRIVKFVND